MTAYAIHPLADSYPLHTADQLAALVEDIQANGQQLPVVYTSDHVLLDGRNRLAACKLAGLQPRIRIMPWSADSPEAEAYVGSCNLRRNMTRDQDLIRRVKHGLPHVVGRNSRLARQLIDTDPDRADLVLAGRRSIRAAANDAGLIQPRARKARAPVTDHTPLEAHRAAADESKTKRHLREALVDLDRTKAAIEAARQLTRQPLPPVQRAEKTSGIREGALVVLASDWHVEERVEARPETQMNSYTLEISQRRARKFFAAIHWQLGFTRQAFQINNLVLWLGGDFTTGNLHDEHPEVCEVPPMMAMLHAQRYILEGVQGLLKDSSLERIDLVCSYGNHGRTTRTMRAATGAGHNTDWVLYQALAMRFENEPRIQVLADEGEHQYHDVFGYKLHFHHGHRVSYGGGVGGISIPVNKATSQWDRIRSCDYHHYGHFHQYIDLGQTMVNGSLIGFNSYAASIKATPEVAQQACYVLDSKRGKSLRSPLWVTDGS